MNSEQTNKNCQSMNPTIKALKGSSSFYVTIKEKEQKIKNKRKNFTNPLAYTSTKIEFSVSFQI